jgi:hypothetical protein
VDAYPQEAWKRLGQRLKQRRPQIEPRYRIRKVFAEENDLTDKTVQEIEKAYRTTFSPEMLSAIEVAYRLPPGNITRFLEGGDLEPLKPVARISQVEATAPAKDPALDVINNPDWDLDLLEEKLHGFRAGRQGEEERRIAAMTRSPWYDRVAAIEMLRRVVDAEERRSEDHQDKRRPSHGA